MIGVVGTTPAGLATAYRLLQRGHDVRVFEDGDESAAGSGSEPFSFVRPRDGAALELLSTLGVRDRLEWTTARTAFYANGSVHPVDAPWELLAYPRLSLPDTARIAAVRSGIDVRGLPRRRPRFDAYDPAAYVDATAEQFLREHASEAVYDRFYRPLLEARFGARASDVAASWVLEHARGERERSRFGRERRGAFAGGSTVLLEALREAVGRERVVTSARVDALEYADGAVDSIVLERDDERERRPVDAVVLATSPDRRAALTGSRSPVPVRTRTRLRVTTSADAALTDAARVTMADDAPFGELVAHAPLRSAERDGGRRYRYDLLDGGDAAAAGSSRGEIEREWLEALATRFAAFDRNDLVGIELSRVPQPVPVSGAACALASPPSDYSTAVDDCYDVGLTRHPQLPDRHVGGALEAGLRCGSQVADAVRRVSKGRPAGR